MRASWVCGIVSIADGFSVFVLRIYAHYLNPVLCSPWDGWIFLVTYTSSVHVAFLDVRLDRSFRCMKHASSLMSAIRRHGNSLWSVRSCSVAALPLQPQPTILNSGRCDPYRPTYHRLIYLPHPTASLIFNLPLSTYSVDASHLIPPLCLPDRGVQPQLLS